MGTGPMSTADVQPAGIRDALKADPSGLANPDIKNWCHRRWQYLFLSEAVHDPIALEVATKWFDKRPPRQRIAERFLADDGVKHWADEQQAPWTGTISNTTLLFCPGMLNGLLPVRAFRDDLPEVESRFSMRVLRSDSNPLAGCAANTSDIAAAMNDGRGLDAGGELIPETDFAPPGDVMLLGYSKGGPDIVTTLAARPELASRIRCAFFWSCPLLGTGAADDGIARLNSMPRIANNVAKISKTLKGFVPGSMKQGNRTLRRADEYDTLACTRDLTTDVREAFIKTNGQAIANLNLPMFTVAAATRHEDVPLVQRSGFKALCKNDKFNDMQVECGRAKLPFEMSTELATVRGHHWDIAYPAFVNRKWFNNMYPRFPQDCRYRCYGPVGSRTRVDRLVVIARYSQTCRSRTIAGPSCIQSSISRPTRPTHRHQPAPSEKFIGSINKLHFTLWGQFDMTLLQ